jgi:hypothetical protein
MELVGKDRKAYVEHIVDILSLFVSPESKLNGPEHRFLVQLVLLSWDGVDIGSREAFIKLNEYFKWDDKSRYVYKFRSELKSKGWLINDRDKLTLPPTLSSRLPDEIELNIKVKNLGYERTGQDNSGGGEILPGEPEDAESNNS